MGELDYDLYKGKLCIIGLLFLSAKSVPKVIPSSRLSWLTVTLFSVLSLYMSQFIESLTLVVNFYCLEIGEVVSDATLTLLEKLLIMEFLKISSFSVLSRAA